MIDLGPATEHDMVLVFIKAEVDSARFKAPYQSCFDRLEKLGFGRQLLLERVPIVPTGAKPFALFAGRPAKERAADARARGIVAFLKVAIRNN
jgi:hypothetical protein